MKLRAKTVTPKMPSVRLPELNPPPLKRLPVRTPVLNRSEPLLDKVMPPIVMPLTVESAVMPPFAVPDMRPWLLPTEIAKEGAVNTVTTIPHTARR